MLMSQSIMAVLMFLQALPQVPGNAPEKQPALAAGPGQRVYLAFGSGRSLWVTRSEDGGGSFALPVQVAEVGALALGRHRGPRLAVTSQGLLLSAVTGERVDSHPHAHGLPEVGELRVWRSQDEGRTWAGPVVVNDVAGAAREGLDALATSDDGRVAAAVWLDARESGTTLYGTWSTDGGATWLKNVKLYASPGGTICQCCHPSLTASGKHEFAVMFRNALDGNRDLYSFRWRPGEVTTLPEKQGSGSWHLDACPMDGGGIGMQQGKMVSVWRREHEIFVSEAGKPERRLGAGKDPALAVSGVARAFTWVSDLGAVLEENSGGAQQTLDDQGGFPVLVGLRDGSGFVAAWEHDGLIRVRHLPSQPK